MPGRKRENSQRPPEFYVCPTAEVSIHPDVCAAMQELWPWFWEYVRQQLGDSDHASGLADDVACRVSAYLQKHPTKVRSFVALCRVAATNIVKTRKTREARIQYCGLSQDIEAMLGPAAPDWVQEVELLVWIDQILQGQDYEIRIMLQLRLLEESWDRIGSFLDLSGGQARLRFRRALQHIYDDIKRRRTNRGCP